MAADIDRARTKLDALVASSRAPGLQYVAVSADGPVLEHAPGSADLAVSRPMGASTTLMAYSMSKTLTAAAVLTLVEAGKLGLDDPIDRHLDANPYGGAITVRQLLSHTSGIGNPLPLRWVHTPARHAGFDEKAALASALGKHPRPSSPPGVRYRYSNIGYWLLGSIVERASARPFVEYVSERVLTPLCILPEDLGYAILDPTRHACGYLPRYSAFNLIKGLLIDRELIGPRIGRWIEIRPHYLDGPAFGGLVGTVRGFGRFLSDQLQPRSALFGEAARALFYEQQRTSNGRTVPMTLGWHLGSNAGAPYFYKEGGGGGFHGMMRLYPGSGLGTAVIANSTAFDAAACLNAVDRELMV